MSEPTTRSLLHDVLLGWSLGLAVSGVPLFALAVAGGRWVIAALAVACVVVGTLIYREERRDV